MRAAHMQPDWPQRACRVSFDGKNTEMLSPNDSVRINIAQWPLPMITAETLDRDWFDGITEKLGWNRNIKHVQRGGRQALPFPAACRLCASLVQMAPLLQASASCLFALSMHHGSSYRSRSVQT
jgi:hypothetical protein